MRRRQFLSLAGLAPLMGLSACQPHEIRRSINTAHSLSQGNVNEAIGSQLPSTGITQIDQLVRNQLVSLAEQLLKQWGDEKVASPKEYVKYTDKYQSRALINFETGVIRVETIDPKDSQAQLEQAIVTTLLTPEDPSKVDLLSDKDITPNGEPFLYKLVLDHQGQPIRYAWRAQQYAKHLIKTAYKHDMYNNKPRHYVVFNMVKDHQTGQQDKYSAYVNQNSKRFNIRSPLIYAIMEAESSFNPYAISRIPAYGLMQIVPSSAGRDAHRLIYGKDGTPSKDYLFVPKNNIQMGTAYLSILNERYLARVKNAQAREYCVIAGYNTGSGNVLKAFHSNRDTAFDQINRLNASQVYQHLVKHLPYDETRRYLQKVTQFETKYR